MVEKCVNQTAIKNIFMLAMIIQLSVDLTFHMMSIRCYEGKKRLESRNCY